MIELLAKLKKPVLLLAFKFFTAFSESLLHFLARLQK